MKTIKGNLILTENTTFNESINVEGNILGKDGKRYNLIVKGDIKAGDIKAGDINAGDIDAVDINAGDIDAVDINAGNINYYAVCFAYNSIKCNSIKGNRNNHKHFVLDGKIIIKEKEKEQSK